MAGVFVERLSILSSRQIACVLKFVCDLASLKGHAESTSLAQSMSRNQKQLNMPRLDCPSVSGETAQHDPNSVT